MRAFAAVSVPFRARSDICAFSDAVQVVAELSAARDVDAVTAIWLDEIAVLWLGEDAIAGGQQRWNELTAEILNAGVRKRRGQTLPGGWPGGAGLPRWAATVRRGSQDG